MRSSLVIRCGFVAALVVVSVNGFVASRQPAPPRAVASHAAREVEAGTVPGDQFLNQHVLAGGQAIADDAFAVAGQQQQQVRAHTLAVGGLDASVQWQFVGPTNIDNNGGTHHDGGGRVADIAVDPTHANTVYIGTAGGGLWKTTDAGATITYAWNNSLPQAIGAVAVDKNGVVWVGTGETNPGGGSITFFGDGIYKSTDGGTTWTNMGLNDSWTIARIVVDPNTPNTVWVAASGNLFIAGHQRGVYKTTDGGTTWNQVLAPLNGTTGASDLAMSQQNTNVLYAGMWDHVRVPDHRTYTGPGSGVWKTTDGGVTWSDLTSATNAVTDHLLADGLTPGNGRVGVAVAPSTDQDVYVNFANDLNGIEQGFFSSTNGGSTFTLSPGTANLDVPLTDGSYVYGWWFAKTFVDPANPLHVFVTDLCLWSSTDGATSFAADCSVHADQHTMAWDPHVANQVFLGDDGGFYRSTDNGATFTPAAYQPWPQFGGLDVSEQDPSRIIGGLQDNGSQRSWNSSGATVAANQWNSAFGGDGQQNLIDPQNQNIVFSCLQYGVCQVSTDGGNTGTEFDTTPLSLNQNCTSCTHTARNVYFTPIAFDPTNPSTVYYAGDVVNVSNDNGNTWRVISPNLGGNNPGTESDPLYAGHFGAVTTISVSRVNPDDVWVATDSGLVWFTTNASSAPTMPMWTQVSGPGVTSQLPTRWVSKVLIDPANPQIVFVAFTGYRGGDNNAYVERTNDGGTTWTNLSGNLPQATVNDLGLINGRLYAATDTGMYVSDPAADPTTSAAFSWSAFGLNLPNIPVTAMRFIPSNNTLYVSTFGRGVWTASVAPGLGLPEVPIPLLLPAIGAGVGASVLLARRRRARRPAAA
jgi:photosystem II stability/assembly factor-like uncharacterized protein